MEKPTTPQNGPYKVKAEKDKTYYWCICGLSWKRPFCDGSHKKEGKFRSLKYLAIESKEIFICRCLKSKKQPFCDGSHTKL